MLKVRRAAPDELKSQAYLVYSEWGPLLSIPRDERLADLFPNTTPTERAGWIADFKAVDREVWRIAETGLPRTGSYHDFEKQLSKAFPFMNRDAVGRAWALATYYTVHEGY